jgi:hypothetical protein
MERPVTRRGRKKVRKNRPEECYAVIVSQRSVWRRSRTVFDGTAEFELTTRAVAVECCWIPYFLRAFRHI